MYYFLNYSGSESKDGCPTWVEVACPLIDQDSNLERQYHIGSHEALKKMEGLDFFFKEKFINFDYFDGYKKILIASEKFINFLETLKCDISFTPVTIKTLDNKKKYINSVRKKYFALMINKKIGCIDYVNSEYMVERDLKRDVVYDLEFGEPIIKYLYQLVVDKSRTSGAPVFYSRNFKSNYKPICSDDFCLKFSKMDFCGIDLVPTIFDVMNYPGFEKGKWLIDKIDAPPFMSTNQ
jgi:hypothetical protein